MPDIRTPTADELEPVLRTVYSAFGDEPKAGELERERKLMPLDRVLAAFDDGAPVGAAASWPFELTIPGGTAPAAGVTWVGVRPSHRRRGVLTELMRHQLAAVQERGEPLSRVAPGRDRARVGALPDAAAAVVPRGLLTPSRPPG